FFDHTATTEIYTLSLHDALPIFRRKVEPNIGKWSLIGSLVELHEDLDDAAIRVLREFTGLDNVFFEQTKAYGKADRDNGYRCVSDRKSTRLNSSHVKISYAVFCL